MLASGAKPVRCAAQARTCALSQPRMDAWVCAREADASERLVLCKYICVAALPCNGFGTVLRDGGIWVVLCLA